MLVSLCSVSSTVLLCDISSSFTETTVDGPVVVTIDRATLVSEGLFSYDDEPVILDVSPRASILRLGCRTGSVCREGGYMDYIEKTAYSLSNVV